MCVLPDTQFAKALRPVHLALERRIICRPKIKENHPSRIPPIRATVGRGRQSRGRPTPAMIRREEHAPNVRYSTILARTFHIHFPRAREGSFLHFFSFLIYVHPRPASQVCYRARCILFIDYEFFNFAFLPLSIKKYAKFFIHTPPARDKLLRGREKKMRRGNAGPTLQQ